MADMSRRSFVVMTAGGVLIPGTAGLAALEPTNDQCTLNSILARAAHPNDAERYVYLVEYPTPDGTWTPSAQLLRESSLMHSSIRATPDRWRLENGHRITMLEKNFAVSVERNKSGTKKMA